MLCQQVLAYACWRRGLDVERPGPRPAPNDHDTVDHDQPQGWEEPMATHGFDVIIVGARVAGAATAMLLARAGLRVLAVDRATFPSDTLSTHQIQVPGVAALARWGLLDQVLAAGTPPTRTVRFDQG